MTGFEPDDDDDRIDSRVEELVSDKDWRMENLGEAVSRIDQGEIDFTDTMKALYRFEVTPTEELLSPGKLHDLYREARMIAAAVEEKFKDVALDQATRESESWPVWRGTAERTQHYAQTHYKPEE